MTSGTNRTPREGALSGLRVLDLSSTQPGAQASQLLADFGAEVISVEPPGGSPLRAAPGFLCWGRGKKSIVLDLHERSDIDALTALAAETDVLIESFRPGVADRLGIGYETLAAANPGLVYTSITGFPAVGPYAGVKGYEALVMAKSGVLAQYGAMTERAGPAYVATPYGVFGAAQTALNGTLAALHERHRSGFGQHVQTSMLHGLAALGPYNWFLHILTQQFPEAFTAAKPFDEDGIPTHSIYFRLIIGLTADGRWLQFSQTQPRLFEAFLRALGLGSLREDPQWASLPDFEEASQRDAFWTILIERIKQKSLAEWQQVFDADTDVWAEVFRHGSELLEHPQLVHDEAVVVVADPDRGPVRQPGALVRMSGTPAEVTRPVPRLDEHATELRQRAAAAPPPAASRAATAAVASPPLAGITVLELGTFYAAPYGGCVLADLGARIIKIEPIEGEPLRHLLAFPEAGGAKVMQGKESVAVDIGSEQGRKIIHDIVAQCDIVLQCYRAGVAERLGLDQASLRSIKPDVVYLNAPGYGVDGPCGHRPAFAPTISAGSGMARRNAGPSIPERPDLTVAEIKKYSALLSPAATTECAQPDGLSALAVATAMLLGLVARDRGHGGQDMVTTMMSTGLHALSDDMVDYAGREPLPMPDPQLHGLHALYRLYQTADGWVFLAAPQQREFAALSAALGNHVPGLSGDARFATAADRERNDAALSEILEKVFQAGSALDWERRLLAADIGCVAVANGPFEAELQSDDFGRASGMLADVVHPTFGPHPRLAPLVTMSRSSGVAGPAPVVGEQTESVLSEFGYTSEAMCGLRAAGVIGG